MVVLGLVGSLLVVLRANHVEGAERKAVEATRMVFSVYLRLVLNRLNQKLDLRLDIVRCLECLLFLQNLHLLLNTIHFGFTLELVEELLG